MHAAGMLGVEDPFCRACGPTAIPEHRAPFGTANGTLYHRCGACTATSGVRASYKHQAVLARAHSFTHYQEPLYQHGIPSCSPG